MNLGDLYRLATMSGIEIDNDGGIKADNSNVFLLAQHLNHHFEQERIFNRPFSSNMFDEDDML